jgi:pimeloyl-ACP methyl ester carboxylesterase
MGVVAQTWYDERGSGEPLVLLHGGLSDARFFHANVGPLAERFRVLTPDQRGHGRTPDVPGPFTFDAMADDTTALIERVVGERVHVAGHSNDTFKPAPPSTAAEAAARSGGQGPGRQAHPIRRRSVDDR